jgi:DNA-nicking Smr family endonuclease
MTRPPRGLGAGEAALWRKLAETVTPLDPAHSREAERSAAGGEAGQHEQLAPAPRARERPRGALARPAANPPPGAREEPPRPLTRHGLDGSWERKLAKAQLAPDLTVDLHGLTVDAAHARLGAALAEARAMGARVVLVIAGKERPGGDHGHADHSGRGHRRGAIRAKLLDWLAAGPYASRVAAVRPAHQRHGGAGAVYVVLRRER